MDELIGEIYNILEDYRADEDWVGVGISRDRIQIWINQFDEAERLPILQEMANIFKKRYCSKEEIKGFLKSVVEKLTGDFHFTSPEEFLRNTCFLHLQPDGKSQKVMLQLFDDIIQKDYGIALEDCGTSSKRFCIYLDDILCTGNTLVQDIKEWAEEEFSAGKTNKQAVADKSTILVFVYVFSHDKNYYKKRYEMGKKISPSVANEHKMYTAVNIKNSQDSELDIIWPVEAGQPELVYDYKNKINKNVSEYVEGKGFTVVEEFYRAVGKPTKESFFTSPDNRIIVENAFLRKGIEILNAVHVSKAKNIRALGFSLPSHKNFGFGTLCFTWRNVPNNTPLVFWYSAGGFTPLFRVTRGGTIF